MRRQHAVTAAGAALLATAIAHAEPETYWVDFGTGAYLVGEVEPGSGGDLVVKSAFIMTNTEVLYVLPFQDRNVGGLLDENLVTQWGGYAVLEAKQVLADRILLTGVFVEQRVFGDGHDDNGGNGDPDGTSTNPPANANPYEPFTTAMIFDTEGEQWGPMLLLTFVEAWTAILESLEVMPVNWGLDSGACAPAPPGNAVARTVMDPWRIHWTGDPEVVTNNGITVYPLDMINSCYSIQTLPDAPGPGDGPGSVDWILVNFPREFDRPLVTPVDPDQPPAIPIRR